MRIDTFGAPVRDGCRASVLCRYRHRSRLDDLALVAQFGEAHPFLADDPRLWCMRGARPERFAPSSPPR